MNEYSDKVLSKLNQGKESISTPIFNSASFAFSDSQNAQDVFSGDVLAPFYARMGNPTTSKLENIISEIDGGIGGVATSSGMGATSLAILSLCRAGDEVICIGGLFSGSYTLFNDFLSRYGIKTSFISVSDEKNIQKYINDKTKVIFCESIGNPNLEIPDFEFISKIANEEKVAFIIDNTLTPLSLNPISLGADLVVYSTTKTITGNASALGGMVIFKAVLDGDKFNSSRYEFLSKFIKKAKEKALIVNAKKSVLRDIGMSANAFASYLSILGLETMPLRVEKINQNSINLAKVLYENNVKVYHPSLSHHKANSKYNKYFKNGCGCLLTIDCETKQKAFKFLDSLKQVKITPNLGDTRTLGLHPASTIYADIDEKTKQFLGISEGLLRFSIGIESLEILSKDFIESYASL